MCFVSIKLILSGLGMICRLLRSSLSWMQERPTPKKWSCWETCC